MVPEGRGAHVPFNAVNQLPPFVIWPGCVVPVRVDSVDLPCRYSQLSHLLIIEDTGETGNLIGLRAAALPDLRMRSTLNSPEL